MKQPTNQALFSDATERDKLTLGLTGEPNLVKLMRIAEGLELLERMAFCEKDPVRQDALYSALAEAKCIA